MPTTIADLSGCLDNIVFRNFANPSRSIGKTSEKHGVPFPSRPAAEKDSFDTSMPTIKLSINPSSLCDIDRQESPPDQSSIVTRALWPNQPIMAKGGREQTVVRAQRPRK